MKRARQHRAYRPVAMTDGIKTWVEHRFDFTGDFTDDDKATFVAVLNAATPQGRIATLRKRVDRLGADVTGPIKMHADAIRSILDRVAGELRAQATREELALLGDADRLWVKIMLLRDVVPLAQRGAKFPAGKPRGAYGPTRKLVRALLRDPRYAGMTAPQLWEACRHKPPDFAHGMTFYDSHAWIEGHGTVTFARFANLVSAERKPRR